jgi:hypothetical protein
VLGLSKAYRDLLQKLGVRISNITLSVVGDMLGSSKAHRDLNIHWLSFFEGAHRAGYTYVCS